MQQILPQATHEVVLGDLFGSQWIKDDEFLSRVHRYKEVIFKDVNSLMEVETDRIEIGRTTIWSGQIYEYHRKP